MYLLEYLTSISAISWHILNFTFLILASSANGVTNHLAVYKKSQNVTLIAPLSLTPHDLSNVSLEHILNLATSHHSKCIILSPATITICPEDAENFPMNICIFKSAPYSLSANSSKNSLCKHK